jgi:hypothetical protein
MLYENSFLDKVDFSNQDFHGGGSDNSECVAGYPILKHLSIPLGLYMRPFPSANIIHNTAISDVLDSDEYDALYDKTLDTHKGRNTRRGARLVTNKRVTKRRIS